MGRGAFRERVGIQLRGALGRDDGGASGRGGVGGAGDGARGCAIAASGARVSWQTWGSTLAFGVGMVSAGDAWANGLTVDFQGMLAGTGDTLMLRNYAVVRLQ
jgi:hypothetical protein